MTENPASNPASGFRPGSITSFGRVFGEGARKLTKLHRQAIAESGSDFPTWMLLTLLSEQESPLAVEEVITAMYRRMDLDRPNVISLLESTAAAGYTDDGPDASVRTVRITPTGSKFFADMYAHSRKTTDAALVGIDPDKLETAINVMLAVDANATALLG